MNGLAGALARKTLWRVVLAVTGMPVSADAALWVAVGSGGAAAPAAVASDVVTRVTAAARTQVLTLAGPPNDDEAKDDSRHRGSSWRARRRGAPGSLPRG